MLRQEAKLCPCPKCGGDERVISGRRGGRKPVYREMLVYAWGVIPEALQWTCGVCGYKWTTPCADAKVPGEAEQVSR
jgi:hypothetical protein